MAVPQKTATMIHILPTPSVKKFLFVADPAITSMILAVVYFFLKYSVDRDTKLSMVMNNLYYLSIYRNTDIHFSFTSLIFCSCAEECNDYKFVRYTIYLYHGTIDAYIYGAPKGDSKSRFHTGFLHKSRPEIAWNLCSRQVHPITLDARLIYYAITHFFTVQFPFSRSEIRPITPSRFPLEGAPAIA